MSDSQIFWIGVFTSVLIAIHVIVNIVQFRKLGRESSVQREEK